MKLSWSLALNSGCQPLVGQRNRANAIDLNREKSSPQVFEDDVTLDLLINQISFIRALSESTDMADLDQRLSAVLSQLGFSDFMFIRVANSLMFDAPISSLPGEFLKRYRAEYYVRYDMVIDYLKTGESAPVYHSEIRRIIESTVLTTRGFKRNHDILALYEEYGFNDAYFIPVAANRGQGDDSVMLAVMAKGMAQNKFATLAENVSSILRLVADSVNFIYNAKFAKSKPKSAINPRPMRLLTLMAKQDLTLSQAASELCISLDTANKHMAMAKKALNTRSQANAIYLAMKQGLIEF